jgi:TnpA family transposase
VLILELVQIADMGDRRFWRIDMSADYGTLNGIASHRIDTDVITRNWDDMLRVVGSLRLGVVKPLELMRILQNDGHPSTLARAIGEIGRIAKSLYMLSYIDDKAYQRRILIQLNKGESRHSLARKVFYGQKGELRQRYQEGQEEQLNALGLVVNAIILWNTLYMDRALTDMRQRGMTVLPEDVARLSPIGHEHVNVYGKYSFTLAEPIQQRDFHPLCEVDEDKDVELFPESPERRFGA